MSSKLKPTLFDRIFRKDRYKEVIKLRNQIKEMKDSFNSLDIIIRLKKYPTINSEIFKKDMLSLNEVMMCNDLGEKAVIERLSRDRDIIYNLLKEVNEIDISDISKSIRDQKLNQIFN